MENKAEAQVRRPVGHPDFLRDWIKAAFTLNGAAIIAVVGFIGGREVIPSPGAVHEGVRYLLGGLGLAFFAIPAIYAALWCLEEHERFKKRREAQCPENTRKCRRLHKQGVAMFFLTAFFLFASSYAFICGVTTISEGIFSVSPDHTP